LVHLVFEAIGHAIELHGVEGVKGLLDQHR
jgi:hypothetical protein